MTMFPLSQDELLALLPRDLAEMANIIPATDVLKLAERFGGVRLYFPAKPDETSELARTLGLPAAQALCSQYAGEIINVPCASRVFRAMRDREIVARRTQGESAGRVALRFKTTMRNVARIFSQGRRAAASR